MFVSLGKIALRVIPLYTGLISTLLCLARSRHNYTLSVAFGTSMKLLPHSDILSTSNSMVICCFYDWSSSSLSGCCSVYATLLGGAR